MKKPKHELIIILTLSLIFILLLFLAQRVGDCLNVHKEEEEKSAPNFGGQTNNGAGFGEIQGGGKVRKGYA